MNVPAVIERELREESRRPANGWLRLLAAGTAIAVFVTLTLGAQIPAARLGAALFAALSQTMLVAFWVIVPLMTADCLSREKREGTLGLLFLTPLTVFDVVLGKAATHVLRALTMYLAALPVLGLPLVLGGVGGLGLATAALQQGGAVLLAMGAGLYASSQGGSAVQAMVRAEGYALVLACLSGLGHTLLGAPIFRPLFSLWWYLGGTLAVDLGLFFLVLWAAIRRVQASWQEETAAPEQPRWVRIFSSSDFWRTAFHWDKNPTLCRNPAAWLQESSWTARLTKWGWCLLLLAAEFIILPNCEDLSSLVWQSWLTAALGAGAAFSAVGSFRREREAGLLELLLVTPLSVRQLVRGRLWGMGCNYFPALAILIVGFAGNQALNPRSALPGLWHWLAPNPLAFGAVMAFGLWLSLGGLNFLLAWVLTWLAGFFLPGFVALTLEKLEPGHSAATSVPAGLALMILAAVSWLLVERNLRLRTFLRPQTS